jgi:hypothetical protein
MQTAIALAKAAGKNAAMLPRPRAACGENAGGLRTTGHEACIAWTIL